MNKVIPIFPLELVVFPGESLNLHIFEPRYRQLIQDCEQEDFHFGIPAVVGRKLSGLGTTLELVEVTKRYEDGRLDIKTRGLEVFSVTKLMGMLNHKLYNFAEIEFLPNDPLGDEDLLTEVLGKVKQLHQMLQVSKKLGDGRSHLTSFDLGHHCGLSQSHEYELLSLTSEVLRLEFLNRHLETLLPTVMQIESLKEKIKLNGHFKKMPGIDV